jgi:hypothetical protein
VSILNLVNCVLLSWVSNVGVLLCCVFFGMGLCYGCIYSASFLTYCTGDGFTCYKQGNPRISPNTFDFLYWLYFEPFFSHKVIMFSLYAARSLSISLSLSPYRTSSFFTVLSIYFISFPVVDLLSFSFLIPFFFFLACVFLFSVLMHSGEI